MPVIALKKAAVEALTSMEEWDTGRASPRWWSELAVHQVGAVVVGPVERVGEGGAALVVLAHGGLDPGDQFGEDPGALVDLLVVLLADLVVTADVQVQRVDQGEVVVDPRHDVLEDVELGEGRLEGRGLAGARRLSHGTPPAGR